MFRIIGNIVMIEMGDTVHAFSIGDKTEYQENGELNRNGRVSVFEEIDGIDGIDNSGATGEKPYWEMSPLERARVKENKGEWYAAALYYEEAGDQDKSFEMFVKEAQECEEESDYYCAFENYQAAFMVDKAKEMLKRYAESDGPSLTTLASGYRGLGMETEYREVMEKIR